jgi:type IX secretion system PorP/SprF family membrane protein
MKRLLFLILATLLAKPIFAQKELIISQYMHHQYTLNTAFGGSGEALSLFGSYRKQWVDVGGAPASMFFAAHTPLKNDQVALGFELFNHQYSAVKNTGATASYTYRIKPSATSWLALSLNAGVAFTNGNWSDVLIKNPDDPAFEYNDHRTIPITGVGVAWYGSKFFTGFSIPNVFYTDITQYDKTKFELNEAFYLFTGGYLFQINNWIQWQPSVLVNYHQHLKSYADLSNSIILQNKLWLGVTYRTLGEVSALAGYQITPQLRVVYSYDYQTGEIGTYNNGSHELSIHYHFGYKMKTASPKFF